MAESEYLFHRGDEEGPLIQSQLQEMLLRFVPFMPPNSLIENGKQTPRNHVLEMLVPIDLALRIVV